MVRSPEWALFVDWCAAAGERAMPTTAGTVLEFLADVPGASSTLARRARAIDEVHGLAGAGAPGKQALASMHMSTRPYQASEVAAALASAPIGGWPVGLVGRRDAAVVSLVCVAGFSRDQVRLARLGDDWHGVVVAMPTTGNAGTCPRCALTRWLRARASVATYGWRAVRYELEEAGPALAGMALHHDCDEGLTVTTGCDEPAFSAIGRHGLVELVPLSRRSISAVVSRQFSAVAVPALVPSQQRGAKAPSPKERAEALRRLDELCVAMDRALDGAEAQIAASGIM
jgi:hypothetical protein